MYIANRFMVVFMIYVHASCECVCVWELILKRGVLRFCHMGAPRGVWAEGGIPACASGDAEGGAAGVGLGCVSSPCIFCAAVYVLWLFMLFMCVYVHIVNICCLCFSVIKYIDEWSNSACTSAWGYIYKRSIDKLMLCVCKSAFACARLWMSVQIFRYNMDV